MANMGKTFRVVLSTVPPNFQYQNKKLVVANQGTFFTNLFLCKAALCWLSKFFILVF